MVRKKREESFRSPPELTKPIDWTGPRLLVVEQRPLEPNEVFAERKRIHEKEIADATTRAARESERRLEILAEQMSINLRSKNGFQRLAFELARALYPRGFEIDFGQCKPGRDKFWTPKRLAELIADVEAIELDRGCSDATACTNLVRQAIRAKRGRYLPGTKSGLKETASTLANRLSEARSLVPKLYALLWFFWEQEAPDPPADRERYIHQRLIEAFRSPDSVRL